MKPLSASQIELFRRCQRKWAFRYLTDLPRPQHTQATSLGTRVHRIAEIYQKTAVLPQDDQEALTIFMPMMPHMPIPKSGRAEHRFDITYEDIPFMGFMDWRGTAPGDAPAVYDYKTSSDPAKYGLQGEADFLTHVQPLLYATAAMQEEQTQHAYMRWVYGKTKGKPKAYKVEAVLSWGEVEPQFQTVVYAPAKEIVRLRVLSNLDPNSLAPNRAACNDFGVSCEYAGHCKPDTEESMGEEGQLLDMLKSLCEGDTPAPAAPAPADPVNRPKRVSSRPPMSERGVFIEATTPPPAAKPAEKAPSKPAPAPSPVAMRSPTAIILEELAQALSRAAERIG